MQNFKQGDLVVCTIPLDCVTEEWQPVLMRMRNEPIIVIEEENDCEQIRVKIPFPEAPSHEAGIWKEYLEPYEEPIDTTKLTELL